MKITVRDNLIIFHRPSDWQVLARQLREDYGPSIILIRDRCRRELGFTPRYHKGLIKTELENWNLTKGEGIHNCYYYQDQVHLDFYSPAQQTFFVLKYLNN